MTYFLSDFMKENKGVELLMDVTNKNKVLESLQNNEVDFALVSSLPTTHNIEKLDLLQNKFRLLRLVVFVSVSWWSCRSNTLADNLLAKRKSLI